VVYHIVTESDLRSHLKGGSYAAASLGECGFVHCAERPSVIAVANDYFSCALERVLFLEVDESRLTAEVRCEAATPIEGGGASHLGLASRFPHVYGPIDEGAIVGVGVLVAGPGSYGWPRGFRALGTFLEAR
jgi:uncharacterized protein (DUF952 family)